MAKFLIWIKTRQPLTQHRSRGERKGLNQTQFPLICRPTPFQLRIKSVDDRLNGLIRFRKKQGTTVLISADRNKGTLGQALRVAWPIDQNSSIATQCCQHKAANTPDNNQNSHTGKESLPTPRMVWPLRHHRLTQHDNEFQLTLTFHSTVISCTHR